MFKKNKEQEPAFISHPSLHRFHYKDKLILYKMSIVQQMLNDG